MFCVWNSIRMALHILRTSTKDVGGSCNHKPWLALVLSHYLGPLLPSPKFLGSVCKRDQSCHKWLMLELLQRSFLCTGFIQVATKQAQDTACYDDLILSPLLSCSFFSNKLCELGFCLAVSEDMSVNLSFIVPSFKNSGWYFCRFKVWYDVRNWSPPHLRVL